MTKTQRAEFLRSRFRTKSGSFAYVPSGKPIRPNTDPTEGPGFGVWGRGGLCEKPYLPPSVALPKKKVTLRGKRNVGSASTITKIMQKTPKKLKRRFATAEAMLD